MFLGIFNDTWFLLMISNVGDEYKDSPAPYTAHSDICVMMDQNR